MNEQLIQRIQELIQKLEEQRSKMTAGTQSSKAYERAMTGLGVELARLGKDADLSARQLNNITNSVNRFYAALSKGQNIRLNLGGERLRTSQFSQVTRAFDAETKAKADAALEPEVFVRKTDDAAATRVQSQANKKATADRRAENKRAQADIKRANDEHTAWLRTESIRVAADRRTASDATANAKSTGQTGGATFYDPNVSKQVQTNARNEQKAADDAFLNREKANNIRLAEDRKTAEDAVARAKSTGQTGGATFYDPAVARQAATKQRQIYNEQIKLLEEHIAKRRKVIADAAKEEARILSRVNIGSVIPGGQKAADNLNARAQAIDPGFTPSTMKRVDVLPGGGYSKVQYQIKTAEGVFKSATFVVDKFGKVMIDTQRRFRSFGDGLARDIVEFSKWSLAVALILGPLQKIGELTGLMIKNEATLADVSIALGNAQKTTNEVFVAAGDIADETAESLDGVLEAYNIAYRATGGAADATERFATANKLLTDSIILSKLSTLGQVEAIDILAAALKQTGGDLNNGQELLNKWVAVSKVANVDLTTLATGFSVLGDAAEAAGMNTDQLNAVIATIAETSSQSGREVANTARAIVAGFQSDQGKDILASFGISTEANGQARDFLDIMRQIYDMRQSEQISTGQFAELTNTLGGGPRRGAAFASFIESFGKIAIVEQASATASAGTGEAFGALGEQAGTVQSAVTRLDNAFQELAQALGENGGVLNIFRDMINSLAGVVKGVTDITIAFGKATPIIMGTVAAMLLLRNTGAAETIGGMVANLVKTDGMMRLNNRSIAPSFEQKLGVQQRALNANSFTQRWGGGIAATGAALLPAMSNLSEGKGARAAVDAAGVILGGAIGAALGGPIGLAAGSNIGGAIAEAFAAATENFKPQFQDLFTPGKPSTDMNEDGTKKTSRQLDEENAIELLRKATGTEGWKGYQGAARTAIYNTAGNMAGAENLSSTQGLLVDLELQKKLGLVPQAEYDRVMAAFQKAAAPTLVENEVKKKDNATAKTNQPVIDAVAARYSAQLLKELVSGDIGKAPYDRGKSELKNLGTFGAESYNAFGSGFEGSSEEFFNVMGRAKAYGQKEETGIIAQFNTDIRAAEDPEARNKLIKEANIYVQQLNQSLLAQAELLKNVDFSEYTAAEFKKMADAGLVAYGLLEDKSIELGKLTREQAEAIRAAWEDTVVTLKDGLLITTKVPNDVIKMGEDSKKQKGLGFSQGDYTREQLASATGTQYDATAKLLEDLGYKQDISDEIFITKNDELIKVESKDMKIVQYLLQQIEKNTSELDGMYNLPEGATFYAPVNALAMKGQPGELPGSSSSTAPVNDIVKSTLDKLALKASLIENINPDTMKRPTYDDTAKRFREGDFAQSPGDVMKKFREGEAKSMPTPEFFSTTGKTTMPNFAALFGNIIQGLSTKLNLNLNSTTILQVDGRQMAQVVKQYLKNDIVRYSSGGSSRSVNMV